jgi:hypothetical protein
LVGWLSGDDVATQYCKYFKVKIDIDKYSEQFWTQ